MDEFRHWAVTPGGVRVGHLGPASTCTNPTCKPEEPVGEGLT